VAYIESEGEGGVTVGTFYGIHFQTSSNYSIFFTLKIMHLFTSEGAKRKLPLNTLLFSSVC